jgi:hypothetical protein
MRTRVAAVAAAAVAAGIAIAVATRRGGIPDVAPAAPEPTTPGEFPQDGPLLRRAPEFAPVADEADLVTRWVAVLASGDDDDVEWARSRLRSAGAAGRRAVRDAGTSALGSNLALVEQALEFLVESPDAQDADFAVSALTGGDAHATQRAARLLARIGAALPDPARACRALADAALCGTPAVLKDCLAALSSVGGPVAAAETVRVLSGTAEDLRAVAHAGAAGSREPQVRAAVRQAFETETETAPVARLAAADALVRMGDASCVPWLEGLLASPPPDYSLLRDSVLATLARERHAGALTVIGERVRDVLEDERVRVEMIGLLANYPFAAARPYLEAAAASAQGNVAEVRTPALEALTLGAPAEYLPALSRMLRDVGREDAYAAVLVAGRVRRPELAAALSAGVAREDHDEEMKALCLRALVVAQAPEFAETVVRTMAADRSALDAQVSLAFNAGAVLALAGAGFRDVAGASMVRALAGDFGPLGGSGLVQILRGTAVCCGPEASSGVSRFLGHDDPAVRRAAAWALGHVAGPGTSSDLRAAWWRAPDADTRLAIEKAMERAHLRPAQAGRR